MTIETERLVLREFNESDFDSLYKVLADSDIMRYYPYTFDDRKVQGWIDKNKDRYKTFGFGLWAVCLKKNGEMIGDCGLTMQNINGVIKPEIGYHIRKDMQRKGYAKEAALAVCNWTFENTPFLEIYSYMTSDNLPSAKCAESWGCRFVYSYLDDNTPTLVYRITKESWLSEKGRK